jgi:hypothetical protein
MWSKPRKLELPSGYPEFDARLGALAFDPATREGILAVSPLALGNGRDGRGRPIKPRRVGFLLSAGGETALEALQAGFARALGRA